jgi:uncharacterized protein YaaQ
VAIVQDKDAGRLLEALMAKGFRATKLASTGGFLREGNTTLFIGVEDGQVEAVEAVVKQICKTRRQLVTPLTPMGGTMDAYTTYPIEVQVGGATIFVLGVERFDKA